MLTTWEAKVIMGRQQENNWCFQCRYTLREWSSQRQEKWRKKLNFIAILVWTVVENEIAHIVFHLTLPEISCYLQMSCWQRYKRVYTCRVLWAYYCMQLSWLLHASLCKTGENLVLCTSSMNQVYNFFSILLQACISLFFVVVVFVSPLICILSFFGMRATLMVSEDVKQEPKQNVAASATSKHIKRRIRTRRNANIDMIRSEWRSVLSSCFLLVSFSGSRDDLCFSFATNLGFSSWLVITISLIIKRVNETTKKTAAG